MTKEQIEVMRGWIRQYYRDAGHAGSAGMADKLCDLAVLGASVPADVVELIKAGKMLLHCVEGIHTSDMLWNTSRERFRAALHTVKDPL